ncbi:MAG: DNA (cytosine-5-)-methyltransferase [Caldilineaceae bacterium]|nr:DNA (cytosine-5-)-methyltransferase [Caldilineaceae bacterium]
MGSTFEDAVMGLLSPQPEDRAGPLRCADLFSGIGGFHLAATNLGLDVVFACDIDAEARRAYIANFGLEPAGNIMSVRMQDIPAHDLLFAGFPCQPFSIIGQKRGFSDPRGELFFEALRVMRVKRPSGVVLENVKQLATMDKGRILQRIVDDMEAIGYAVDAKVLNAIDFGLPQKRERAIIVGTQYQFDSFPWPEVNTPMRPLAELLEPEPDPKYNASLYIQRKRAKAHTASVSPSIWHENKGGNISSHPWSCALRANASHNYLLVDGKRHLTPRELLRLQGFPDSFQIVCNDRQTRKQAGNAVPVPMVQAVIEKVVQIIERTETAGRQSAKTRPAPAWATA